MKLLIKKRSDRLKKRSKSPVKIQLSLGRFSIKIPNFGKIFLDFLSNLCSGDPPSSSRESRGVRFEGEKELKKEDIK